MASDAPMRPVTAAVAVSGLSHLGVQQVESGEMTVVELPIACAVLGVDASDLASAAEGRDPGGCSPG